MPTRPSTDYRPDIDGLRAVAVLAVMLFHIDKRWLPGGFIGVDVFFVISGYLITRHIVGDLAAGRFSIGEFYRRRVKRIAPAMLTVIAATLLAAQWLLLPEDASEVAKSAVWSLASAANVHFWLHLDTGYFAASSREVPLLHLWSLGIEEQFYLLWPLLLMAFYRPTRVRWVLACAALAALASFVGATVAFAADPGFAYYMLPTRAGELLIGAITAIAVLHGAADRLPTRAGQTLGASALAAVLACLVFMSEDLRFPGLPAVLPTAAAALLIFSAERGLTWAARALAWGPLVWVGRVSYSAYLWHWPLLAFYRYGHGEVGPAAGATMFGLTLLLAWATYRFIEQPARRSNAGALRVVVRQFLMPASATLAVALGAIYLPRLVPALQRTDYQRALAVIRSETRAAFEFDYVCQRQRLTATQAADPRCVVGAERVAAAEPPLLLWGDSNAAQFVGLLGAFGRSAGFQVRNLEVGACPPLLQDPAPFVGAPRLADCRASLAAVRPALDQASVVVISAAWPSYQARSAEFLAAVFDTVRSLTESGKQVILIGKIPDVPGFDRRCEAKALRYPGLRCGVRHMRLADDAAALNAQLREFAERTVGVAYYELTPHLCPAGECASHNAAGAPLYFDASHLRMSASWQIGREIIAAHGVPAPFDRLGVRAADMGGLAPAAAR